MTLSEMMKNYGELTNKDYCIYVVSEINNYIEEHCDEFECDEDDVLDYFSIGWENDNYDTLWVQCGDDIDTIPYTPKELIKMIDEIGINDTLTKIF